MSENLSPEQRAFSSENPPRYPVGRINVEDADSNLIYNIPFEGREVQSLERSSTLGSIRNAVRQMHPNLYESLYKAAVCYAHAAPSALFDGHLVPMEFVSFDQDRFGEKGEHFLYAELIAAYLILRDCSWVMASGRVMQPGSFSPGPISDREMDSRILLVETIPFSMYRKSLMEHSKAAWNENSEYWNWLVESWSSSPTVRRVFSLGVGSAISTATQQSYRDRSELDTIVDA